MSVRLKGATRSPESSQTQLPSINAATANTASLPASSSSSSGLMLVRNNIYRIIAATVVLVTLSIYFTNHQDSNKPYDWTLVSHQFKPNVSEGDILIACNPEDFGAIGDGAFDSTIAIQEAIDACSGSPGVVRFPRDKHFVAGTLRLRSNLKLIFEEDSSLAALNSADPKVFPLVPHRCEGETCQCPASLLHADGVKNLSLIGIPFNGKFPVISGTGDIWQQMYLRKEIQRVDRPRIVTIANSSEVEISSLQFVDSPFWTIHLLYSTNLYIHDISVLNSVHTKNTDGIDIDSSSNVLIERVTISTGDDCICIKSGKGDTGRTINKPSENIVITNSLLMAGHGSVVFGSETSGSIRNVSVNHCVFLGTERGIRIKTNPNRGGTIEDINLSNIYMRDVIVPFLIEMNYTGNGPEPPGDEPTEVKSMTVANVYVEDGSSEELKKKKKIRLFVECLEKNPCENIEFNSFHFPRELEGFELRNVKSIEFKNCGEKSKIRQGDFLSQKAIDEIFLHNPTLLATLPLSTSSSSFSFSSFLSRGDVSPRSSSTLNCRFENVKNIAFEKWRKECKQKHKDSKEDKQS